MTVGGSTEIIDIRSDTTGSDILQAIKEGLRPANGGEKRLPTLLLYDEAGLRLFEKITYLEEYYLTNAEIEVGFPSYSYRQLYRLNVIAFPMCRSHAVHGDSCGLVGLAWA